MTDWDTVANIESGPIDDSLPQSLLAGLTQVIQRGKPDNQKRHNTDDSANESQRTYSTHKWNDNKPHGVWNNGQATAQLSISEAMTTKYFSF